MPEGDRYPRPTAVLALSSGGEHRGTHVRLDPLPTHDAAPASHPRQWTLRRPEALCRLALRAAGFAARPRYLSAPRPRKMLRIRDVFVSTPPIANIIGFDHLPRLLVDRQRVVSGKSVTV